MLFLKLNSSYELQNAVYLIYTVKMLIARFANAEVQGRFFLFKNIFHARKNGHDQYKHAFYEHQLQDFKKSHRFMFKYKQR